MWRLRPAVLRAAAWTIVAVLVVRRRTHRIGVRAQSPSAPLISSSAHIGVRAVLDRLSPTCLERALVLQAVLSRRGEHHDIVIGIPTEGMSTAPAHAWLDDVDLVTAQEYREIHRLPVRP